MKTVWMVCLILAMSGCGAPPSDKAQSAATKPQSVSSGGESYIRQGMEQLKQTDLPGAIKSFDEAIKQSPRDPRGYLILGQTYMRIKEYDRAIDTFTAALRVAPDQGEIYYMLALNCKLAGKNEEAVKNAEKGLNLFRLQKDELNFRKTLVLLQSLSATPGDEPAAEPETEPVSEPEG